MRWVNRNDANGYYKTLGLSPDATREEIKAAYRKLVKRLHPDRDGDEELFRFVVEIANVLLDPESKITYDSVDGNHIFLGDMEREELARFGYRPEPLVESVQEGRKHHWACFTGPGILPGEDTDAWIEFCRQVSPAVGYRGKIRVGVVDGGQDWPCDPSFSWGILTAGAHTFVVFQNGDEPNRLTALCAMIDWQKHLQNQIKREWARAQEERSPWL